MYTLSLMAIYLSRVFFVLYFIVKDLKRKIILCVITRKYILNVERYSK